MTTTDALRAAEADEHRLMMLADNRDGHAVCCMREYLRGEIPMPSLPLFTAAEKKLEEFQTSLYLAAKARKAGAA